MFHPCPSFVLVQLCSSTASSLSSFPFQFTLHVICRVIFLPKSGSCLDTCHLVSCSHLLASPSPAVSKSCFLVALRFTETTPEHVSAPGPAHHLHSGLNIYPEKVPSTTFGNERELSLLLVLAQPLFYPWLHICIPLLAEHGACSYGVPLSLEDSLVTICVSHPGPPGFYFQFQVV